MSICKQVVDKIQAQLDEILSLRDQISEKDDGSYVSEGDILVQHIVFEAISELLPDHELISEELAPFNDKNWDAAGSYVILDPIDGTENFVSGLREWGVGISGISPSRPGWRRNPAKPVAPCQPGTTTETGGFAPCPGECPPLRNRRPALPSPAIRPK